MPEESDRGRAGGGWLGEYDGAGDPPLGKGGRGTGPWRTVPWMRPFHLRELPESRIPNDAADDPGIGYGLTVGSHGFAGYRYAAAERQVDVPGVGPGFRSRGAQSRAVHPGAAGLTLLKHLIAHRFEHVMTATGTAPVFLGGRAHGRIRTFGLGRAPQRLALGCWLATAPSCSPVFP